MPPLEESREVSDSNAIIDNHEACRIRWLKEVQCLRESSDCPVVDESMSLALPRMENCPQTSTVPYQTEHRQYLRTTSEPPPTAAYMWYPTHGQINFDSGPQLVPHFMSRPDFVNYGPQPTYMSNPDYNDNGYPSQAGLPDLVWAPPHIARSNVPRNNEWTTVCGIVTPGHDHVPSSKKLLADAKYHCPRCDTPFSRRYTVKQHFPGCIHKHGNPKGLRWIDHPSLDTEGKPYSTRRLSHWNLSRSKKHRFRMVDGATANQPEPGNLTALQADQQAQLHLVKVETQPPVYTAPTDLEISKVDTQS